MTTIHPPRRLDRKALLEGVETLVSVDRGLGRVVEEHGPPPLWARRPGFATLIQIMIEQQVSLASGKAILERLTDSMVEVTAESILALGKNGLRGLGVTRQKSSYCVGLAEAVTSGNVDFQRISRASDAEARDELMRIKGVGPWTADVYLLMALRRPDVWPTGDIALHAAMVRLRRLADRPGSLEAAEFAERWSPWRSVAARILWHGYLSGSLK